MNSPLPQVYSFLDAPYLLSPDGRAFIKIAHGTTRTDEKGRVWFWNGPTKRWRIQKTKESKGRKKVQPTVAGLALLEADEGDVRTIGGVPYVHEGGQWRQMDEGESVDIGGVSHTYADGRLMSDEERGRRAARRMRRSRPPAVGGAVQPDIGTPAAKQSHEQLLAEAESYSALLDTVKSEQGRETSALPMKGRVYGEFLVEKNGTIHHIPSGFRVLDPRPGEKISFKTAKRIAAALHLSGVPVFGSDGEVAPAFRDAFYRTIKPIVDYGADTVLPAVPHAEGDRLTINGKTYELQGGRWVNPSAEVKAPKVKAPKSVITSRAELEAKFASEKPSAGKGGLTRTQKAYAARKILDQVNAGNILDLRDYSEVFGMQDVAEAIAAGEPFIPQGKVNASVFGTRTAEGFLYRNRWATYDAETRQIVPTEAGQKAAEQFKEYESDRLRFDLPGGGYYVIPKTTFAVNNYLKLLGIPAIEKPGSLEKLEALAADVAPGFEFDAKPEAYKPVNAEQTSLLAA